ncbi:HpcH/HpaI aldolase/citrate lyase family protein [Thermocrispum municipale]|uniref:HpcH/HpaI aldolase/citrate lyase family protein n=1 Tax=Thermocrispum municipale TaxID=37926 RepID=UPI00042853D2|nr:CoA ester lyase [Thermocrispum municipale]
MTVLASARTLLFVPGNRPDRFAKAAASGADAVVLDLEDAVAPEQKPAAREHVAEWLKAGNSAVVRVNAAGTPWHDDDVAAVGDVAMALMVPKAERAEDLPRGTVIPLVETAAGIDNARAVCSAPGVVRPAFGSVDLAAELGVDPASYYALLHARSALVLAAAAAGCAPPVDGVTTSLDEVGLLRADTAHAVELGFTGKLCIHPRQIEHVHAALRPTDSELDWARRVVAAADGGVSVVDGQMVDRPVVLRAERLLSRGGTLR